MDNFVEVLQEKQTKFHETRKNFTTNDLVDGIKILCLKLKNSAYPISKHCQQSQPGCGK